MSSDEVLVACADAALTFGRGPQAVVAVHDSDLEIPAGDRLANVGPVRSGNSSDLHPAAGRRPHGRGPRRHHPRSGRRRPAHRPAHHARRTAARIRGGVMIAAWVRGLARHRTGRLLAALAGVALAVALVAALGSFLTA